MDSKEIRNYTKITDELRAEIIGSLLAGLGVRQISRTTSVSPAAISKIKAELDAEIDKNYKPETKQRIDDLLINSLKTHLEAIEGIAQIAKDEQYLRTQDGRNLAELHSGFVSWSLQLLEAASRDK